MIKPFLRGVRWNIRRLDAARKWGSARLNAMPVVIGNSMPKSGSHLIIQILEGLPKIGPFINPGMPPLNRNEQNDILPETEIIKKICRLRPGDFTYSYLVAEEPYYSALTKPGMVPIFIYRDPRDVIISHVFYATEMHQGHAMHDYYTRVLSSMEERITAAILGVNEPGVTLTAIRKKYDRYLAWLDCPAMLSLRFEELIQQREQAIQKLLDFLQLHGFVPDIGREEAVALLQTNIQPKKSGTFRKGQPGNWREHFSPENIRVFKEYTGDLLMRLGYETSPDW